MKSEKEKNPINKTILITIVAFVLILVVAIVGTILVVNNSNKNKDETPQEQKTTYYYCYRAKDMETSCGDVPCTYTGYYRFTIVNEEQDTNKVTKHVDGQYISIYKFTEENFDKAQKDTFVSEGSEYKIDAPSLTYIVTKDMIIQPNNTVEFNYQNEINHLNSLGFNDCMSKEE